MELREYWRIVRRRWWLPVLLMLLTGVLSAVQLRIWQPPAPSYSASLRLLVGVLPASEADASAYDPRYYAWLTSEYLVDDFSEVVRSQLFADNVQKRLQAQQIAVPAGVIQGSASTGTQHRIISLHLTWPNAAQLEAMAQAAADELSERAPVYFQQLGTEGAGVTLLDRPQISAVTPPLAQRLNLPLRMLAALVVGIGLVFLLDYLDTSVRDRTDLEALGIATIAEIPRQRRRSR